MKLTFAVMPFVALTLPEKHYESLQAESTGGGHDVIEHIGERFLSLVCYTP
jgi:hypothetical protein